MEMFVEAGHLTQSEPFVVVKHLAQKRLSAVVEQPKKEHLHLACDHKRCKT